ncbi:MAG TPA: hypothetical protein VM536_22335 [Chloroflexia bacterium]|nr:hypothetical protein [Chloroflexia bacterium]
MKRRTQLAARPLTLAEVCEAIADGKITAEKEGDYYTITHRALRRLRPEAPLSARLRLQTPHLAEIAS